MATQNDWVIGGLYGGGLLNGQPFYTQPNGIGTEVLPTQKNSVPWPEWPAAGVLVINEYNPIWAPGCGHSLKFPHLIPEYDYDNDVEVMLVACFCGFVQRVISPRSETYNPIANAIIIL